jgi:hypothetical protein
MHLFYLKLLFFSEKVIGFFKNQIQKICAEKKAKKESR